MLPPTCVAFVETVALPVSELTMQGDRRCSECDAEGTTRRGVFTCDGPEAHREEIRTHDNVDVAIAATLEAAGPAIRRQWIEESLAINRVIAAACSALVLDHMGVVASKKMKKARDIEERAGTMLASIAASWQLPRTQNPAVLRAAFSAAFPHDALSGMVRLVGGGFAEGGGGKGGMRRRRA